MANWFSHVVSLTDTQFLVEWQRIITDELANRTTAHNVSRWSQPLPRAVFEAPSGPMPPVMAMQLESTIEANPPIFDDDDDDTNDVPRRPSIDANGMCHYRVCNDQSCTSKWCDFSFDPEKFPAGWEPHFDRTDSLIAYGVDYEAPFEESREDIIANLGGVKTQHVKVREGKNYGFVVCYSHKDALRARKHLIEDGRYKVKFLCSNIPKEPNE